MSVYEGSLTRSLIDDRAMDRGARRSASLGLTPSVVFHEESTTLDLVREAGAVRHRRSGVGRHHQELDPLPE